MELSLHATYDTVECVNVFHIHPGGGGTEQSAVLEEFWLDGATDFASAWLDANDEAYLLHSVVCRSIWREGDGYLDLSPSSYEGGWGGTSDDGGERLSPAMTQVATIYTGRTGRRHRGRVHFLGGTEGSVNARLWVVAGSTINHFRGVFMNIIRDQYGEDGSVDFTLGVFSRADVAEFGATTAALAEVFQPMTAYALRPDVRWLRSRQF